MTDKKDIITVFHSGWLSSRRLLILIVLYPHAEAGGMRGCCLFCSIEVAQHLWFQLCEFARSWCVAHVNFVHRLKTR